jgi:hypothetical protein
MAIQKGSFVEQIPQVRVRGVVTEFGVDQEKGVVTAKVEWEETDTDGTVHQCSRYFYPDQIRESAPPEA